MSLQEISTWLANPAKDYKTGLSIYNQYKTNNKFDDYFNNAEDPKLHSMHFKLLVQRIKDIYRKIQANPATVKQQPQTLGVKQIDTEELKKKSGQHTSPNASNRARIVENPLINPKDLPEDLQNLYFENKKLTKELSVLHNEMADLDPDPKNDETRKQLAEEICSMDDTRSVNWSKIDTWWKDKKLTGEKQKKEFDAKKEILQISRRVETLKINISREEKRLKNNPEMKKKLKPKIDNWKKELKGLEAKLK